MSRMNPPWPKKEFQPNAKAPLDGLKVVDLSRLVAGNMLHAEVETCRHDASIGVLLEGDGKGHFKALPWKESGVYLPGDVKGLALLNSADGSPLVIAGRNSDKALVLVGAVALP